MNPNCLTAQCCAWPVPESGESNSSQGIQSCPLKHCLEWLVSFSRGEGKARASHANLLQDQIHCLNHRQLKLRCREIGRVPAAAACWVALTLWVQGVTTYLVVIFTSRIWTRTFPDLPALQFLTRGLCVMYFNDYRTTLLMQWDSDVVVGNRNFRNQIDRWVGCHHLGWAFFQSHDLSSMDIRTLIL